MLGFHPYFAIRQNYDGRVVNSTRRPHFTSKEVPWHSFMLAGSYGHVKVSSDISKVQNSLIAEVTSQNRWTIL